RQMEGRMSAYDMAFDAEPEGDEDNAYKAPAYYLEDQSSNLADQLEDAEWEEVTNNSLHLALSELDERSKDILRSRWLSDHKATLHDLADKYGVSAERIRQLEKNAMNKIKARMAA
ncbi:MAG: sigma-70 family RNA polymerase sigma factor, partial [Pseudohongiellaceae bacterium]